MTDPSTLPAATDDNQLGAHLCQQWDKQRAAGMTHGKWCVELGRFVTLMEITKMIISAKIIRKPRKTRHCSHCLKPIKWQAMRLYGAAHAGDKPYVLWLHSDCVGSDDPKVAKAKEALP